MSVLLAFSPSAGDNQVLTSSGTSQSVNLISSTQSVRVCNAGSTNPVHVRIGTDSVTATTSDTPVLPGESIVLRKADGQNKLAYIQSGGATTLHVQCGSGGL